MVKIHIVFARTHSTTSRADTPFSLKPFTSKRKKLIFAIRMVNYFTIETTIRSFYKVCPRSRNIIFFIFLFIILQVVVSLQTHMSIWFLMLLLLIFAFTKLFLIKQPFSFIHKLSTLLELMHLTILLQQLSVIWTWSYIFISRRFVSVGFSLRFSIAKCFPFFPVLIKSIFQIILTWT